MRKSFIFLIMIASISCNNTTSNNLQTKTNDFKENNTFFNYTLKNDSIDICMSFVKDSTSKNINFNFNYSNNGKSFKITGIANLILLEDENGSFYVPEGTFILDEMTNQEYLCDSTYDYISDKINISFGFEKQKNKRLSLVIYKSKVSFVRDKQYTLYKSEH